MAEKIGIIDPNTIVKMYIFRFGSSDQIVQLNQQQLDDIPYLSTLVAHKNDFSSVQNKNDEYVLNHPIEYLWFIPILRSVTSKNPYDLLHELSKDVHVLDTVQLYDYLCIKSFALPLLKDEDLILSNPVDVGKEEKRVKYHKANLSEARQTAAEFVIALAKNEYKLSNSNTVKRIYSLVRIILSNASVFSSQFRYHTLIVVKECCYSFFSKKQQHLLPTTQQIDQHNKTESFMYLYDNDKSLPDNFQNVFSSRGVYVTIEEEKSEPWPAPAKNTIGTESIRIMTERTLNTSFYQDFEEELIIPTHERVSFFRELFIPWTIDIMSDVTHYRRRYAVILGREKLLSADDKCDDQELPIYEIKQSRKQKVTKSASSGHFNTLPKRSNVDKFKYRSGCKAQKYR